MFLTHTEFIARPLETEWLIEGLLPPSGSMVLYGPEKTGKSFAAIQLALAITGETNEWLGFQTVKHGKVVYIQLDTSPPLWQDRFTKLGIKGTDLHHADLLTLGLPYFDIMNPDHAKILRADLENLQPTAVFIDTVRESHLMNENDSTEMKNVVTALLTITYPATLILITHARKPNESNFGSLTSEIRGSTYLAGKMDAVVKLSRTNLRYTGRAIEQGKRKIHRMKNGLWEVVNDPTEDAVAQVLADVNLTTDRARAKALADLTNIKEERARSILRRKR